MIISFKKVMSRLEHPITGIIHIGANDKKEEKIYKQEGIEDIIWVDANPECEGVINELVWSSSYTMPFYLTNRRMCSSAFELEKHLVLFPTIEVEKEIELTSITLPSLIKKYNIDITKYNFLNMDVQGAEWEILFGAGDFLNNFQAVYCEFSTDSVFKYNPNDLDDLDDILKSNGFVRVLTKCFGNHPWGDALYVNKTYTSN